LLTSTQPEEGKTTVTINLALTMMLAGKRILIVDADLRRPRIHHILNLADTGGFADLLAGKLGVQDVIQVLELASDTGQDDYILSVITSGRPSPNSFKLLASPKVKEAIVHFTETFDTVLLDSPPALSVSDSLLLAPMVDGVILVVNTGAVTEKDARRAKERLEQAGGHILGVAMNRFSEKLHGPAFHPYHSYYLSRHSSRDRSAR
jgi:capsular exopolysaccharide synthesis family protein